MLDVIHVMAVKLLRILGLCTPWRRPHIRGDADRMRSVVSQVRDRRRTGVDRRGGAAAIAAAHRPAAATGLSLCSPGAGPGLTAFTLFVPPPLNLRSLQS